MSFDGLVMAAVKKELDELLAGGRIEKIYQPLANEITLLVHRDNKKHRLLISADARDARIHITGTVRENPLSPPLYCMVLRKHLEGGRITGFEQHGLERVLTVKVEAVDELGMLCEKKLICEIMGKHSNIILTDPATNVIIDGIKRYSYATSRHREVLPGRQYTPPPEPDKLNPLEVSEDEFRSAVWNPEEELPVEKIILDKFAGFGPQTCREIVTRAGIDPALSNQSLGELELSRLWEEFRKIRDSALAGDFRPTLCYLGQNPLAFSSLELTQFRDRRCKSGTMNEILDEFFSVRERLEKFEKTRSDLMRIVRNEIKKNEKKSAIHKSTLKKTEDTEWLRIYGELITANIYQIPGGAESVELINYYDPAGRKVTVELDPQLSPSENAQQYFKRYAKARNSREAALKYLAETKGELDYLESILVALNQTEDMHDLEEIRSELIKEGYLRQKKTSKAAKKPEASGEPEIRSFVSEDGFEILVGRNNRQNDYLTMKIAKPQDIWLHAKDIPGSHVVIRNPQSRDIPDRTLLKAAETAAFFSRARESSRVAVDYTVRKNVRKPKGAKPGMVIYDNYSTLYVEPKSP